MPQFPHGSGQGSGPDSSRPPLTVGFILLPQFTLLPFAAFIDTLRLSADEGDQSRQVHCHWTIMGQRREAVVSSCGVAVTPWEGWRDPAQFNYIVVVGGRLKQGPLLSPEVVKYLLCADEEHVPIVGLCTAPFALLRAGLMNQRRCCVSWFHYQELVDEFPCATPVADQLFVDDGDRITCAGGAAAADLAAYLVERHLGQSWARSSLRILLMDSPRPGEAPQPQPAVESAVSHPQVKRAILLLEQNMSQPLSTDQLASRLQLSRRQLERLFRGETGESLQKFYRRMRLQYGLWLLQRTKRAITMVALECGFSDAAHFSRSFQAEFDIKPSAVREQTPAKPV